MGKRTGITYWIDFVKGATGRFRAVVQGNAWLYWISAVKNSANAYPENFERETGFGTVHSFRLLQNRQGSSSALENAAASRQSLYDLQA